MRHVLALCCLALGGAGVSAAAVPPPAAAPPQASPASQVSITLPGQTQALSRPTNIVIHDRRDDNGNDNAQIQQLQQQVQQQQQQVQQQQQQNAQSLSSLSSSFSSRFNSLSTSASNTISQLQSSLQSAQQAANTLQQSADEARRSADDAGRSVSAAMASVSAAAAQASQQSESMAASAASAADAMSTSMSSVMAAAVSSASASISAAVVQAEQAQQAQLLAGLRGADSTVTMAAAAAGGFLVSGPTETPSSSPSNALGACSTPEVVLAFAGIVLGAVGVASLGCVLALWYWRRRQEARRNGGRRDDEMPASRSSSRSSSRSGGSSAAKNANKNSGLAGESQGFGGNLRQWRIRASVSKPRITRLFRMAAAADEAAAMPSPPMDVSLTPYKLPDYEQTFLERKGQASRTDSVTPAPLSVAVPAAAGTAAPARGPTRPAPAAVASAVSTNNRVLSTWSVTTAGDDNGIGNNMSSYFTRNFNFSRSSRLPASRSSSNNTAANAVSRPRPTSSVYDPLGNGANPAGTFGLDRISRMEEEWNRSQMQAKSGAKKPVAPAVAAYYATNYDYYTKERQQQQASQQASEASKTEAGRSGSQSSVDSLAREYHDFVSQLAPISQYGGQVPTGLASTLRKGNEREERVPVTAAEKAVPAAAVVPKTATPTALPQAEAPPASSGLWWWQRSRAQRQPTATAAGALPQMGGGKGKFATRLFDEGLI